MIQKFLTRRKEGKKDLDMRLGEELDEWMQCSLLLLMYDNKYVRKSSSAFESHTERDDRSHKSSERRRRRVCCQHRRRLGNTSTHRNWLQHRSVSRRLLRKSAFFVARKREKNSFCSFSLFRFCTTCQKRERKEDSIKKLIKEVLSQAKQQRNSMRGKAE